MAYWEALAVAVISTVAAGLLLGVGWLAQEFICFLYELYPPAGIAAGTFFGMTMLALIIWGFDHMPPRK